LRALTERYRATAGGLPPAYWVLWWGTLVNRLGNFVVPFLALYLVRARGFDPAAAGQMVALFGMGGTGAAVLGGVLADRLGRRPSMLGGMLLSAASVGTIPFVRAPLAIAALALLAGASNQIYQPAVHAAVADVVPAPERRRAYGLLYWAVNMGLTLGYAIASLLAARGLAALFLADAATTLVCAALIALRIPETRPSKLPHAPVVAGILRVLSDGPFLAFLGLQLAALVVFTQWQLAFPLDLSAHGLPPSFFALMMAYNCAGVVLVQPWLTPLLHRFDGARLLAVSATLFGVGFGLNAVAGTVPVYLLGVTCWTLGEIVGFPVASALVADLAPPDLRGRYQGAFSTVWGLALTLSPLVAGKVLQGAGARTLWLSCLATGLLVAVGHLVAAGPRRRRLAQLAAAPAEPGHPEAERAG
jgi:MFS family permease